MIFRAPLDGCRERVLLEDRRVSADWLASWYGRSGRSARQHHQDLPRQFVPDAGRAHRGHRAVVRAAFRQHAFRLHLERQPRQDQGRRRPSDDGASDCAANLGAYFENDRVSARLVANYRSEYVNTTTAPTPNSTNNKAPVAGIMMFAEPTIAAPVTTLAFNASYNISPNLILSFDATNLTNVSVPTIATAKKSSKSGRDRPPVLPEPEVQVLTGLQAEMGSAAPRTAPRSRRRLLGAFSLRRGKCR